MAQTPEEKRKQQLANLKPFEKGDARINRNGRKKGVKNWGKVVQDLLADDEFEDNDVKTFKVVLGEEAYQIVTKAVKKVQDDNDCSEARAIELICADYLAGS